MSKENHAKYVYHITFDKDLPKKLKPQQPDGYDEDNIIEDLPPRVSFSPTVEQCWMAVYANIKHYIEDEKFGFPYLTFYVYRAEITDKTKVLDNKLVESKVKDALMTGEICVIQSIEVELYQQVKITPTKEKIYYQPFGNTMSKMTDLCPRPEIEVLYEFIKDSVSVESMNASMENYIQNLIGLKRDRDFVDSTMVERDGTIYTTKKTAIEFPSWYLEKNIASFGERVSFYGIFITIVDDKYAVSRIPTIVRSNPINITTIVRGGVDFTRLEFGEDDPLLTEMTAVQETLLSYEFFNNFFIRNKIPWFCEYEDLVFMMDNLMTYANSLAGANPIANELVVAFVTRAMDNKDVYYRQTDMTKGYVYVDLMNLYHSIKTMVGKLGGGYLQEALVSALVADDIAQSSKDAYIRN